MKDLPKLRWYHWYHRYLKPVATGHLLELSRLVWLQNSIYCWEQQCGNPCTSSILVSPCETLNQRVLFASIWTGWFPYPKFTKNDSAPEDQSRPQGEILSHIGHKTESQSAMGNTLKALAVRRIPVATATAKSHIITVNRCFHCGWIAVVTGYATGIATLGVDAQWHLLGRSDMPSHALQQGKEQVNVTPFCAKVPLPFLQLKRRETMSKSLGKDQMNPNEDKWGNHMKYHEIIVPVQSSWTTIYIESTLAYFGILWPFREQSHPQECHPLGARRMGNTWQYYEKKLEIDSRWFKDIEGLPGLSLLDILVVMG